jgi:hypothetical protein
MTKLQNLIRLIGKSSINGPFSIAMLNYQRLNFKFLASRNLRLGNPLSIPHGASGVSRLFNRFSSRIRALT